MDLVELGRVLQERRKALGIPQAELARRIEVSASYVWMIEQAKRRESGEPSQPSEVLLEKWADALGWDDPYTRQLLALAGHTTPSSTSTPSLPFGGAGALHFPQPRSMEEEVLVEELRELLTLAREHEEKWEEVVGLLRSFLRWLRFRVRGES